jgi:hypothetical protein
MDRTDADRRQLRKDYNAARNKIAAAVKARWPELSTAWHPRVQVILRDESADVVRAIESHAEYAGFDRLRESLDALDTKHLDLERRWVKYQRLVREANDVALAANLPKVATEDVQARYAKLIAAENGTLGKPAADSRSED